MTTSSMPASGPSVNDYAAGLQLLKAQHIILSAKREQLALEAERQRDCAADLAVRTDFLHQRLAAVRSPTTESRECLPWDESLVAGKPPKGRDFPPANQAPILCERTLLTAARHWYAVAQQLTRALQSLRQLVHIDPYKSQRPAELLASADRALYLAKH